MHVPVEEERSTACGAGQRGSSRTPLLPACLPACVICVLPPFSPASKDGGRLSGNHRRRTRHAAFCSARFGRTRPRGARPLLWARRGASRPPAAGTGFLYQCHCLVRGVTGVHLPLCDTGTSATAPCRAPSFYAHAARAVQVMGPGQRNAYGKLKALCEEEGHLAVRLFFGPGLPSSPECR